MSRVNWTLELCNAIIVIFWCVLYGSITTTEVDEFRWVWNLLTSSMNFDERADVFLHFAIFQREANLFT